MFKTFLNWDSVICPCGLAWDFYVSDHFLLTWIRYWTVHFESKDLDLWKNIVLGHPVWSKADCFDVTVYFKDCPLNGQNRMTKDDDVSTMKVLRLKVDGPVRFSSKLSKKWYAKTSDVKPKERGTKTESKFKNILESIFSRSQFQFSILTMKLKKSNCIDRTVHERPRSRLAKYDLTFSHVNLGLCPS